MKIRFLVVLAALVAAGFSPAARAYQTITPSIGNLRWDQSTLLAGFLKPDATPSGSLTVTVAQGKALSLPLWRSRSTPKGLWIVVPGTGSSADDHMAGFVAERAAATGYDVVVVPNPFSVSFQESVSTDGIVGFPQRDLGDLVKVINAGYQGYVAREGRPARVNVMGISLGATYALLLETRESALRFAVEKFVAVNPPVEFQYAMNQLDSMISLSLARGPILELEREVSYLLPVFLKTYRNDGAVLNARSVAELRSLVKGDAGLHREIIGTAFQTTLRTITGNLTHYPLFSDSETRIRISNQQPYITFGWYEGFVDMRLEHDSRLSGKTLVELAREASLSSFLPTSRRLADTYVVGTKDDFLLAPGDLGFLERELGDRLYLFSSGGHCGEIWLKEFQDVLHELAR